MKAEMNCARTALAPLALVIAVSSCTSDSPAGNPTRETLPNGALLVRYPSLPATDAVDPAITDAPVDLQFGSLDGDDPNFIFADVRGVQAASDGTIYVLDFQAAEVRTFDSEGQYLRTIARPGEGPGEIGETNGIFLSGDTLLWMHDHRHWAVIGIDPEGVEKRRFPKQISTYGYIWSGIFDHRGRYWRATSHSDEQRTWPPEEGLVRSNSRRYYKSYNLESEAVDSVYLGEGVSRSYIHANDDGWSYFGIPFQESGMTAVNPPGGFWRAQNASYRIARIGEDGDTLLVIEAGLPAEPVTDGDRSSFIYGLLEGREDDPSLRRTAEAIAGLMPEVKPVLAGLVVDDEDRLWVERTGGGNPAGLPPVTPGEAFPFYDLFSQEGDYLGSVRLGFEPAIGHIWVQHGNIYSVVNDELDIPYVVRAPLR